MTTTVEKCPTCGGDALDRSDFWESVAPNGNELTQKLYAIEKAVKKYYLALDRREHGSIAQDKALTEIQEALGMTWLQGEMTQHIEANPDLKRFYT